MSTVKADNFTWKTGQATGQSGTNVTGDQIVYGTIKVWVNFTSITTTTISKSYNISSLTRNGTGDTTASFTTSLLDSTYCPSGICRNQGSSYNSAVFLCGNYSVDPTTSSYRFWAQTSWIPGAYNATVQDVIQYLSIVR